MPIDLIQDKITHKPKCIAPKSFGCHAALLAQSGSGKSFLLGRLIEELLIKTKVRVLVLDPNSDFVRLGEINEDVWKTAELRQWLFPGDTLKEFKNRWSRIIPAILSNRNLPNIHAPRINWGALSDIERANVMNLDPAEQPELYWALVLAGEISRERWNDKSEPDYDFEFFRSVADELCDFLLGSEAPTDFSDRPLAQSLRPSGPGLALRFRTLVYSLESFEIWRSLGDGEKDITEIVTSNKDAPSLTVVDLLSVNTDAERLALTTRALSAIWKAARDSYNATLRDVNDPDLRVPTVVIIEEAHNIMPVCRTSPAAERLAEDILRIAAEGRKFGLFLLLVTQRPRKIDPGILSECDSLFLMKMTNDNDLNEASNIFGFIDPAILPKAKNLEIGDVFLQGKLGRTNTLWHVAPRRTRQGGKNLDENYWSVPYADTP